MYTSTGSKELKLLHTDPPGFSMWRWCGFQIGWSVPWFRFTTNAKFDVASTVLFSSSNRVLYPRDFKSRKCQWIVEYSWWLHMIIVHGLLNILDHYYPWFSKRILIIFNPHAEFCSASAKVPKGDSFPAHDATHWWQQHRRCPARRHCDKMYIYYIYICT